MNLTAAAAPADPRDITFAELLPFLSFRDLRRRAFLWPGMATAIFGVALFLFASARKADAFYWCLGVFISLVNIYMVYLWCGKKTPFPYLLLISTISFFVFAWLSPLFVIAEQALPRIIAPGLVEEIVKVLPLLVVFCGTWFLSHARQRKYGLRQPLDGILLATASATGFAFLETMFVYAPRFGGMVGTARLLVNIFSHIAFAAAFGYFIGLAALHHHNRRRVILALVIGFVLANVLHDLWDVVRFFGRFGYLSPLHEVVVAVASFAILASVILKAREISPEHEFLWPFSSLPPYRSPEVPPLQALPWLPGDFWLAVDGKRIRLTIGQELSNRDLPQVKPMAGDGVVARIEPHPRQPGVLVMRNLSSPTWKEVLLNGAVREVARADVVALTPCTRIDFGGIGGAVLITPLAPDPAADQEEPTEAAWL